MFLDPYSQGTAPKLELVAGDSHIYREREDKKVSIDTSSPRNGNPDHLRGAHISIGPPNSV